MLLFVLQMPDDFLLKLILLNGSINELKGFLRAVRLNQENNEETDSKIHWLNSQFSKQAKYIQEVEKQIRDNNIEPFSEIVENLT